MQRSHEPDAAIHAIIHQDEQLLRIVDASFADAARRSGEHLACRPGCTQCCHGAFAITPLDALRLRTAMATLDRTQPARAAAIRERAHRYLAEFAPVFPGNTVTGVLGDSEEDQAVFEDFANQAACPALNPESGLCDVYDARPMTCRVFGPPVRASSNEEEGLAVCELCFTQATPEEIAAAEMSVPHAGEAQLLAALNNAEPSSAGDTIVAFCLT